MSPIVLILVVLIVLVLFGGFGYHSGWHVSSPGPFLGGGSLVGVLLLVLVLFLLFRG